MCNNYKGINVRNLLNEFNADAVTRLLRYYHETLLLENGFQKDCWYSACVYNKTNTQKN